MPVNPFSITVVKDGAKETQVDFDKIRADFRESKKRKPEDVKRPSPTKGGGHPNGSKWKKRRGVVDEKDSSDASAKMKQAGGGRPTRAAAEVAAQNIVADSNAEGTYLTTRVVTKILKTSSI